MSYAVGLSAYIYGYPAIDYGKIMRDQTTPGQDPHGVYAPVNRLFSQTNLAAPGSMYAGRAPNNDTLYFTGWLDLRAGPVVVEAPDTHGRYYALTYADFYSEVQHTGRRTTGTKSQKILVAGPDWRGTAPPGMRVIRLNTRFGYLLGRILIDGPEELDTVKSLVTQFKVEPLGKAISAAADLPAAQDLTSIDFFKDLNRFLRDNPRRPGEEALMAQFDMAGFGPKSLFDPAGLSEGARKGLERAIADGHKILSESPRAVGRKGWGPIRELYGQYGFDYLRRATVEFNGLLGNLPEESTYPSLVTDQTGNFLVGKKQYRLVFKANELPPVDAFWSLSAYDALTVDLIPNAIARYSIGDRTKGLKRKSDGSIEILIQNSPPADPNVNWLPVGDGLFFLVLRMYQPRPEAFGDNYHLPALEVLQAASATPK